MNMDKMEGLRAGIAEMRSVAQRLLEWANDMEASFRREEAQAAEVESGSSKSTAPVHTLPEVRAVLAEKCAAGFSAQVEALIKSYGVEKLRDLPADRYEELLEAVKELGDMDAG